jgi:hypothetical protein
LNHGEWASLLERRPFAEQSEGKPKRKAVPRMGKRARKSKARKKKKANHGKRPTGR